MSGWRDSTWVRSGTETSLVMDATDRENDEPVQADDTRIVPCACSRGWSATRIG